MSGCITAIENRLAELLSGCINSKLRGAMTYSLFAGGKRLRPQLLLAACEAAAGAYNPAALDFACAVEMLHTYSLIHDDLPAMDDDDFRRGKPSCHKQFGEAAAILAGDGLLTHAFWCMARACVGPNAGTYARAAAIIAGAAGINGMVAGQMADIEWQYKKAGEDTLLHIHELKTAALFGACMEAGTVCAGAAPSYTQKAAELGKAVGLLFQIKDDILDVTERSEILGKPAGSDERNEKNTYITVYGLEKAKTDYNRRADEAAALLDALPQRTGSLRALIEQIIKRVN